MHGSAILSEQSTVGEHMLEGCTTFQDRAHSDQTIKPIAKLPWEALTDEVRWKPFTPEFPVRVVA
jgi:hypothetical protein